MATKTAKGEPPQNDWLPKREPLMVETEAALARSRTLYTDEQREEWKAQSWEQLESYRALYFTTLSRLTVGIGRCEERQWPWMEPDWKGDPEGWPLVAKTLYLVAKLDVLATRMNFARGMPERVHACEECGEPRPRMDGGWWPCMAHENWEGRVRALAADLFQEAGAVDRVRVTL